MPERKGCESGKNNKDNIWLNPKYYSFMII